MTSTEYLEAHLSEQLYVFLITMIEVNPDQFHVIFSRFFSNGTHDTFGSHILSGQTFAGYRSGERIQSTSLNMNFHNM